MARHGLNTVNALRARNRKIIAIAVVFLCLCCSFAAGFVARGNTDLLQRLGFDSLVVSTSSNPGQTVTGNTYDSISARVAEVEGVVAQESIDAYDLEDATGRVLDAFAESTKDPYLTYYDQERYAAYLEETARSYTGIGVLFGEYRGKCYAVEVFPGSAAEAAGVQAGDFVAAIDGDRAGWSLAETVNALAREEGSQVVVTWRRPGSLEAEGGPEITTTLLCSEYAEQNVHVEVSDAVGYIKLSQLSQNSDSLVSDAISSAVSQGARSLVLDLRDNPGGYLTSAVDTASLFVRSGVVVQISTVDGTTTRTASGEVETDLPLVVLVNQNTAGAAEVLAAALQDNQRATVVGETTLGKGGVQVVRELSFGGALRYTAATYLTPLGREIQDVGVVPSVSIAAGEGPDDAQKTVALETAQSLMAG